RTGPSCATLPSAVGGAVRWAEVLLVGEPPQNAVPFPRPRVLVSEAALLFLSLSVWLALLLRAGAGHPLRLEMGIATLLWAGCLRAVRSAKLRAAASVGLALWIYVAVARLVPALQVPPRDAMLLSVDRALFGVTPAVLCERMTGPAWTDLFS